MADGRIPKDLLYGELVQGNRPRGRPQLQYKDICKADLKALGIDLNRWEILTSERSTWRQALHHGLSQLEETLVQQAEAKRKSSKIRELDRGQIVFVFSVEGIVTLELAFSATLDAVPSPPYRACYHSLLRLKDAKSNHHTHCPHPKQAG